MYLNGTGPESQEPTEEETILANRMLMQVITDNIALLDDPNWLPECLEPEHTPDLPLDLADPEVTPWLTEVCHEVTDQFIREYWDVGAALVAGDTEDGAEEEDHAAAPPGQAEPEKPAAEPSHAMGMHGALWHGTIEELCMDLWRRVEPAIWMPSTAADPDFLDHCALAQRFHPVYWLDHILPSLKSNLGRDYEKWEKRFDAYVQRKMPMRRTRMAGVTSRDPDWICYGLLARGELTMVSGRMGVGKTWYGLYVAAVASHGGPWPTGAGWHKG